MSEEQDEEQWLYGDEKDENKEDGEVNDKGDDGNKEKEGEGDRDDVDGESSEKDKDGQDKDEDNDSENKRDDDDSSDDDDLTITIGTLKTQPDIIQAPTAPHPARFQPKAAAPTSGLKDDDFTSPGKVNGVSITEFNLNELEDKPWRKPGADISDYFNYGFNEESWFKYCERQKRMRVTESGAGLGGLGISVTKPFGNTNSSTNIPVAIINDNSKYGGVNMVRPKPGPPPRNIPKPPGQADGGSSKIQVMTADRREYSNKVMNGPPPTGPFPAGYNDMEFGGNPYGDPPYYSPHEAPPPFYGVPPPFAPMTWGSGNSSSNNQNNWEGSGGPGNNSNMANSSNPNFYDDSSNLSAPPSSDRDQDEDRHRSRRSHRSRSRSPTRHKHSSSRHRSRSRSPSHRHKRKKSKRERDD